MLAAQIAEHFELGRDLASAARFRTRAEDNASRRFAAAEAEEHYTCALRLLEKLFCGERGNQEIGLLRRCAAARHAHRFDDAVQDYEAMLARARRAAPGRRCDALAASATRSSSPSGRRRRGARSRRVRGGGAGGSPPAVEPAGRTPARREGRLASPRADDVTTSAKRGAARRSGRACGTGVRAPLAHQYAAAEALGRGRPRGGWERLPRRSAPACWRARLASTSARLEALATFQAALSRPSGTDSFWGPARQPPGVVHRELRFEGPRARHAALQAAGDTPEPVDAGVRASSARSWTMRAGALTAPPSSWRARRPAHGRRPGCAG
jgi:hypothetical protein